jgi:hypothetical protein
MTRLFKLCLSICALCALRGDSLLANPPVASYIFPAGGQKGTKVPVRVGGLFLHEKCGFDLRGNDVIASKELTRTNRIWFEGPLLPIPESQQAEDYPADMLGRVEIGADALVGPTRGRLWTAQGAAGGLVFVVGDLPEVVEHEIDGEPIPERVSLPVTANGRIFPRDDVDLWEFVAAKGQAVTALAVGLAINSPLLPRLEILDAAGRVLAEQGPIPAPGADTSVRFVAPAAGVYRVRITDARSQGGPSYVYRLTITAGPAAETVFPLGGRRGRRTEFRLTGQAVPDSVAVALPAGTGPGTIWQSLPVSGVNTPPVLLDVDDFPEFVAPPAKDQPIVVPAVLNGQILTAGAADVWPLALSKDETYSLSLLARRLGSPLFASLVVTDASGKKLAAAVDGGPATAGDPVFVFRPQDTGTYFVRVAERFRGRSGPAFAYRLKVTGPDDGVPFRLAIPTDALSLVRGGRASLPVSVERVAVFAAPIEVAVTGLPEGVTAKPLKLESNQSAANLTFEAAATAPVKAVELTVTGTATVASRRVTRPATVAASRAVPPSDTMLLGVGVPTPFRLTSEFVMTSAPRGGIYRRRYAVERDAGFTGPVEVRLADRQARHLQGVAGPSVVVTPDQRSVEYPATLPPWMELGRTCRVCVMAVGKVRDADGREHMLSYSSTEPNMQMIVVVGPGRLGLELGATSLRAVPGGKARLPIRVARGTGLSGPVSLDLVVPAHWRGVSAARVVVPAGRDDGELAIRFAASGAGPFNMPATVRASAGDEPVTAEAVISIVSE